MSDQTLSSKLFAAAKQYIPGGVNSPVRAFRNVGGEPFFVKRAKGCRIWDVDGRDMIDYVGTWGPAPAGHLRRSAQRWVAPLRPALRGSWNAVDVEMFMGQETGQPVGSS